MTTQHDGVRRHGTPGAAHRTLSRRALLRGGLALGAGGRLASLVAEAAAAAPAPFRSGSAPSVIRAQETPRRGGSMSFSFNPISAKMDPIWSQSRIEGIVLNQMIECLVRPNRSGTDLE